MLQAEMGRQRQEGRQRGGVSQVLACGQTIFPLGGVGPIQSDLNSPTVKYLVNEQEDLNPMIQGGKQREQEGGKRVTGREKRREEKRREEKRREDKGFSDWMTFTQCLAGQASRCEGLRH
ncbi:hypothetical protein INR49_013296 [Caranx melampygus]|nr:hypothetical protein INR49_013296 [Caranx melampygus]